MAAVITGLVVALLGAVILAGGIWLAVVGGSLFYILMGAGLLLSAYLLLRRRQSALAVYAGLLVVTFIWTLWEVGFDKWQWIPRGALITFIGLWMALPFVVRNLRNADIERGRNPSSSPALLRATVAVIAVLAVGAWFHDPVIVEGELPAQTAGAPATAPGGEAFPAEEWTAYGGTNAGQRYSSLSDIKVDNVKNLKVAWEHHTGDLKGPDDASEYTFEATPLKVNDTLYYCTPHNIVEALDPVTGELKWKFDPGLKPNAIYQHQTCRGVSYFDEALANSAPAVPAGALAPAPAPAADDCARRIIATTVDARMVAISADTGQLCQGFGQGGYVNLLENMPEVREATYMQTSAPLVARSGLIILGGSVADNYYENNTSGVIRAFDARTGAIVWKFDAQKPNETAPLAPGQTYEANSPVAWTTFSADEDLGLVYIPFGNKAPDQFGRNRTEQDEQFVDALVALDIATGQLRWKFQSSYHDLWDRDNPSQPTLIDLPMNGQTIPAVILPTKGGNLFVLNRQDGKPVLPVSEMQVSTETDVPNEKPSPVQPVSSLNFTPPPLTESDMWGVTPVDQLLCRVEFNKRRYDGNPFTPPTIGGSLVYPGNIGVFNWGSVAVDPVNKWLIATPIRLSHLYDVLPRPEGDTDDRLLTEEGTRPLNENLGGPYAVGISQFRSGIGLPCQTPPWGLMAGVDLTTGKTAWMRRNGTVRDQKIMGFTWPIPFPMGIIAHGGTLTTAGGVSFTAATLDNYLRAYDMRTGEKLWEARLPAGGQATPMTYRGSDGKQYVVLAAGGHGSIGTTPGDSVIAYTLE
ncbi:quinoprotein [Agaricicola taiwanensis]|uniref:Quinoprotein n=1 Tax=Agaricicola taiwanensis TaxID=591372 RepID=A0A8J2YBW8_9RHOB|nr:membrane-bound PQQ-dependent dehydrogenase, glucose/quinate/shikimate family [Agaricicola taiwanensis]GGE34882.1 quinoprotein [Agaricicola taiwanensis]